MEGVIFISFVPFHGSFQDFFVDIFVFRNCLLDMEMGGLSRFCTNLCQVFHTSAKAKILKGNIDEIVKTWRTKPSPRAAPAVRVLRSDLWLLVRVGASTLLWNSPNLLLPQRIESSQA